MNKQSWKNNNTLLKENQQNRIKWPTIIEKSTPVRVYVSLEVAHDSKHGWNKLISSYGKACDTIEKMYDKCNPKYKVRDENYMEVDYKLGTDRLYGKNCVYFYFEAVANNGDVGLGFDISPVSKEEYDTIMRTSDDLEYFNSKRTVWDFK